jgi:pimeloyl-ACP methyl ester carboxylesterase
MRPDLFTAVAALSVPFRPRNAAGPPLALLRAAGMENFYWFYFGREGVAEAEFERDVASAIRRCLFYGSGDAPEGGVGMSLMVPPGSGFLRDTPDPASLPSWLSETDIQVYAAAFRNGGFRGPFSWYRNIDRNWATLAPFQGAKISPPALFIAGARDSVIASPMGRSALETLRSNVPNLRGKVLLPGAGHWIQQERPREVNEALLAFLVSDYRAKR